MVDLQSYKTAVYGGINDVPRAPTAEKAGNASDLISRKNGLIDALEGAINGLEETLFNSQGGLEFLNFCLFFPSIIDTEIILIPVNNLSGKIYQLNIYQDSGASPTYALKNNGTDILVLEEVQDSRSLLSRCKSNPNPANPRVRLNGDHCSAKYLHTS